MGAFDAVRNILLPDDDADKEGAAAFRKKWKWEPGEVVILKGSYSTEDQEIVENAGGAIKGRGKSAETDLRIGSARVKYLEVMIVDWTLAMGGRKVEVSRHAIKRLPSNYRTPILEKIDEIVEPMSEEEQEDFLASSNGHTKAASEEMSPFPTSA